MAAEAGRRQHAPRLEPHDPFEAASGLAPAAELSFLAEASVRCERGTPERECPHIPFGRDAGAESGRDPAGRKVDPCFEPGVRFPAAEEDLVRAERPVGKERRDADAQGRHVVVSRAGSEAGDHESGRDLDASFDRFVRLESRVDEREAGRIFECGAPIRTLERRAWTRTEVEERDVVDPCARAVEVAPAKEAKADRRSFTFGAKGVLEAEYERAPRRNGYSV